MLMPPLFYSAFFTLRDFTCTSIVDRVSISVLPLVLLHMRPCCVALQFLVLLRRSRLCTTLNIDRQKMFSI